MNGHIACRVVIEDWMVPFAVYTVAETPNVFQWARRPPNITHFHGGCWLPSNAWFLGTMQVSPQTTSWSVQPCAQETEHAVCDIGHNMLHACMYVWEHL